MDLGTIDGWLSALLSGVAVIIGVVLAGMALKQSGKIAQNQAAIETESYLSGRMQGLVEHARATVLEARTIQDLASPRLAELLSLPVDDISRTRERQTTVMAALTRLQVEVELLRIYAITMPNSSPSTEPILGSGVDAQKALNNLMDEGAWLYSEALHLSILSFENADHEGVELSDDRSVVDALLNGSFVNLETRLLSDCAGQNPDDIPSYSEPGSPWPAVYKRRESILRGAVMAKKSWRPDSLAEAGVWSLDHTLDRFQDSLMDVLRAWNDRRSSASF